MSDWDDIDFNELLARVIAIATETIENSEGKPYWLYSQEAHPFFIAKIERPALGVDGEELDQLEFRIRLRHITGNRTEGYVGEAEQKLYEQSPKMMGALLTCGILQSEAYPEAADWIDDPILESGGDVMVFDASGIGGAGMQVGTDWVLLCTLRVENEERYY